MGDEAGQRGWGLWWPALAVVATFTVAAAVVLATGVERGRGAFDQINYHEPAILRFADEMPRPDVSDYLSATTPGYHIVLAGVARWGSDSLAVLRVVGAVFTAGLLAVFVRWLTPRAGAFAALAMGLCLIGSVYVFSAGVYLLPDNAAWLGVLGVVLIALRPRVDGVTLIGGGAALAALVLVRQNHLWAAGALWAAGWLGSELRAERGLLGDVRALLTDIPSRIGRMGVVLLATLPALGAVAWFVFLWDGLTVPIYHGYMHGANPATPAFILAQLGVIGVFHAGYWGPGALRLVRERPAVLVLAVAVGVVLVVIPETTYSFDEGRYGGLWGLANRSPDFLGHTNTLIALLATCGAGMLAAWLSGVTTRQRWVLIAALVGFTLAMTNVHNAWQRYHEPMLLIMAGLMSALVVASERGRPSEMKSPRIRAIRIAGPALLAALLGVMTAQRFATEPEVGPPLASQKGVERPLRELWPSQWERVEHEGFGAE